MIGNVFIFSQWALLYWYRTGTAIVHVAQNTVAKSIQRQQSAAFLVESLPEEWLFLKILVLYFVCILIQMHFLIKKIP